MKNETRHCLREDLSGKTHDELVLGVVHDPTLAEAAVVDYKLERGDKVAKLACGSCGVCVTVQQMTTGSFPGGIARIRSVAYATPDSNPCPQTEYL